MADYYGTWRTNYFTVKNPEEFMHFINQVDGMDLTVIDEGERGIMMHGSDIPSIVQEKILAPDGSVMFEEDDDMDFTGTVQQYLADDSVMILMEAGHEKARYICGLAIAVAGGSEDCVVLHLDSIHQMAKDKWPGKTITDCSY